VKGLRTKLREARKLVAQSRLREADQILGEIDAGLDLDHQRKQEKKDTRRTVHQTIDKMKSPYHRDNTEEDC